MYPGGDIDGPLSLNLTGRISTMAATNVEHQDPAIQQLKALLLKQNETAERRYCYVAKGEKSN